MKANPYDDQTAKFAATILTSISGIPPETMQTWIENPKMLKKNLKKALCPSDDALTFDIWRTVKIGTGLKTSDDFVKALEASSCEIEGSAETLMKTPQFQVSGVKRSLDLLVVSPADLGFNKDASGAEIYQRAKKLGLHLCPPETGPQLRLQYEDQPEGGWLLIAMDPIRVGGNQEEVFVLWSNIHGVKRLFTHSFSHRRFQKDARWVFCHQS